MSLAETTHAAAKRVTVTAIGISRQNAMPARVMFPRESQLLFQSISIWNNGAMES